MNDSHPVFALGSEFLLDGSKVVLRTINATACPPAVTVIDSDAEHIEIELTTAIHLWRRTYGINEPCPEKPGPGDSALTGLAATQRQKVQERAHHAREILYGDPSGIWNTDSDTRFDPSTTTLTQRIDVKAADLKTVPGYSASSLRRFCKAIEAGDIRSLAPYAPTSTPGKDLSELCEDTVAVISATLREQAALGSTINADVRIASVSRALHKAEINDPALSTNRLKKVVKTMSAELRLDKSARSRRAMMSRSSRGHRRARPSYPGELLEIDSTPLNFFVRGPGDNVTFRPWVVVAVCVLTRIMHIRLTPTPPTSLDVRKLLFDIYAPQVDTRLGTSTTAPIGRPNTLTVHDPHRRLFPMNIGTVVTDHGREYENTAVIDALHAWGCDVQLARTRTGSDKPNVESANRTLDHIQQMFPGYVGSGPEDRGDGASNDALFSFAQAQVALEAWVTDFYHHRPHSGMPSLTAPRQFLSPIEAYDLAMMRGADLHPTLSPDHIYALLDTAQVTVSSDGVRAQGLRYDGPALHQVRRGYVSPASSLKKAHTVSIDPNDRSRVFFRDESGTWHVLYAINRHGEALPAFSDTIAEHITSTLGRPLRSENSRLDDLNAFAEVLSQIETTDPRAASLDRIRISTAVGNPLGVPDHTTTEPVDPATPTFDMSLDQFVPDSPLPHAHEEDLW